MTRPQHIAENCDTCSTALVLFDVAHGVTDMAEIWDDEWWCPVCQDGVYLDWPVEEMSALWR